MTLKDLLLLIGGFTSFAGCYVLHRILAAIGVQVYLAILLATAASFAAHWWFWVEWYGAKSRHGGFLLWVGIHPIYPVAAIGIERDARRKRAAAQEPEA